MAPMRAVFALCLALALVGVLLPAERTAQFLVGAQNELAVSVTSGIWILKGLLCAVGVLLAVFSRWSRGVMEGPALVETLGVERGPATAGEKRAILVIVGLALALRLIALGRGLWFDEIDTLIHYVRLPLRQLLALYDSRNNHLLYSVLANVASSLVGEGAVGLRLPAALLGTASVWAVWWFGRRVTGAREALLAAAVLACSYHHLSFSQNARGYTGMLFFVLVGSACFVDLLERRRAGGAGPVLAYGLSMGLAAYTHPLAVVAAAGHGLVWLALLWSERRRALGRHRWLPAWGFAWAALFGALFYAPVLPQFLGLITEPPSMTEQTEWKEVGWMVSETLRGLAAGLPGGWAALAVAAIVGVVGLLSYMRQSPAVLAFLLLGTALTLIAIQVLHLNLWPRYFFLYAGFFVLIACRGLFATLALVVRDANARARAEIVLGLLVVAACAWTLPRGYAPKQDYEAAAAYVQAARGPRDAVVTCDMAAFVLNQHLGAGFAEVDSVSELTAIEAAHDRTWFLYTFPMRFSAVQPALFDHLRRMYVEDHVFYGSIRGGELYVLAQRR